MQEVTYYTDTHETDIYGLIDSLGQALCVDCAVSHLFKGNIEDFEAVDNGTDTSCIDSWGNRYDIVHEGSVQYAQSSEDFYPHGLNCSVCKCEIVQSMGDL